MAESFVGHAREFVRMSDVGFVGRFGGHVARTAGGFPGLTADQVATHAISLHPRHGQAVIAVLEPGFKKHVAFSKRRINTRDALGALPHDPSLLTLSEKGSAEE